MNSELKHNLDRLHEDLLGPRSFRKRKPGLFTRSNDEIEQAIEIFEHRARFSARSHWRYLKSPFAKENSFDFSIELSDLEGISQRWFPVRPYEAQEEAVMELGGLVRDILLPFLERFFTVRSILEARDRGEFDDYVFGEDKVRQQVTKGVCLEAVGRLDEAKRAFAYALHFSSRYRSLTEQDKRWLEFAKDKVQ